MAKYATSVREKLARPLALLCAENNIISAACHLLQCGQPDTGYLLGNSLKPAMKVRALAAARAVISNAASAASITAIGQLACRGHF